MPLVEPAYSPDTQPDQGVDLNITNKNTIVADAGPMGTMADVDNANSDQISVYIVRKGDTVAQIAKMFDVSENTVRWANDLKKGSSLTEGQKLVILPISGIQYTVKKGDTIKGVAKKFSGDADEIISFNDLPDDGDLTVGDTIVIPNGETTDEPAKQTSGSGSTSKKNKFKKEWMNYPSYDGYYAYPMEGGHKTQGIHGHNAVDLADSCDVPIYAAASGEVIISRNNSAYNGGYGNYVVISHPNGTQTLYAHMSNAEVDAGQDVTQGQLIGEVGHTGHTIPKGPRGCHLHFEVRGAKNPF
jgi:murein DD-endopeptidase MepM/ murein hydrolase activator NlpD